MITAITRALILSLLLLYGSSLIVNGQGLPRDYWQDMTTEEFEALDAKRVIACVLHNDFIICCPKFGTDHS